MTTPAEQALEVYGYCLTCDEHGADASASFGSPASPFAGVARRIQAGRCSVCGSDAIAGAHTVAPTTWGAILDPRFLRGRLRLVPRPKPRRKRLA